jgi:hypothetical protein
LGGCSIVVCLVLWACTDRRASVYTMSQLAFGLAFAANHPHFLASYALLYGDFRKEIFRRPRYFWAAAVVPSSLGLAMIYAFARGRVDLIGHGLNLMGFLVGWHYVKQVFGCIVVTSARRGLFYGSWERRVILGNLFSLWALSWIQGQIGRTPLVFYGIVYPGLHLPVQLLGLVYPLVVMSAAGVVGVHVGKYVNEGVKPSAPGMAALGALYVWYLPTFSHPSFAYLIPFFHSLQYLAFVWSFKKNQVAQRVHDLEGPAQRLGWVRYFAVWGIIVVWLGAMSFDWVPKFLDSQSLLRNPALGTSPFVAAFLMFINIHHYFIDNVIWRSDNEEIKRHLFAPGPAASQARAAAGSRAAVPTAA